MIKNTFFEKSKKEQAAFQWKLGSLALLINAILMVLLVLIDLRLLPVGLFFLFISISIIAPFFDVPLMVKRGHLLYHSLFLLAEKPRKNIIKIHGGTLFDYYFSLPQKWTESERTKFILAEYLQGLINLAETAPKGSTIKGTSYFLHEKTAAKAGLKRSKTDLGQTFILTFNYFNLLVAMSFAKKKLVFPKLRAIKTYQGTATEILEKKAAILKLVTRLSDLP